MPRSKGPQKTRLNLELPDEVRERLEELQHQANAASLTEIVRRGLSLYDLLFTLQTGGGSLIIRQPDGSEEKLRLL